MAETTFMVACKKFFGALSGQTLTQFAAEVGRVTRKDREEIGTALEKELGVTITDITSKTVGIK